MDNHHAQALPITIGLDRDFIAEQRQRRRPRLAAPGVQVAARAGTKRSDREVDAAIGRGQTRIDALAGVPLALKDILVQQGSPATAGSKILQGWMPPYNATVTQKLL
ncbi:MAG: hypothetical protein DLM59_17730, partial [Pseudonocardiales bacterium]